MSDFSHPFTIEYDTSEKIIKIVLMLFGQPIAYMSEIFKGKALLLLTYEYELFASVVVVKKCAMLF